MCGYLGYSFAACVHLKYLLYDWSRIRVNLKTLVLIHLAAKCNVAPSAKAFLCVVVHAPLDFLRQFITVILCMSHHEVAEKASRWIIGKTLCNRKQGYAIFI